jgi:hypothetical protein
MTHKSTSTAILEQISQQTYCAEERKGQRLKTPTKGKSRFLELKVVAKNC